MFVEKNQSKQQNYQSNAFNSLDITLSILMIIYQIIMGATNQRQSLSRFSVKFPNQTTYDQEQLVKLQQLQIVIPLPLCFGLEEGLSVQMDQLALSKSFQNFDYQDKLHKIAIEDNRLEEVINDNKKSFEFNQGQLVVMNGEKKTFIGSSCLLYQKNAQKQLNYFILTAAHNLVQFQENNGNLITSYIKEAKFLYQSTDLNKFTFEFSGKLCIVYPNYQLGYNILDGNDIGLIEISKKDIAAFLSNEKNKFEEFNIQFENSLEMANIDKNDMICIVGYPESQKGKLFKCETHIKDFISTNIIKYDGEISKGLNGSPIYLLKKKNRCYLIGVHSGFDENLKTNIGTLFSKEIFDWITSNLNNVHSTYNLNLESLDAVETLIKNTLNYQQIDMNIKLIFFQSIQRLENLRVFYEKQTNLQTLYLNCWKMQNSRINI